MVGWLGTSRALSGARGSVGCSGRRLSASLGASSHALEVPGVLPSPDDRLGLAASSCALELRRRSQPPTRITALRAPSSARAALIPDRPGCLDGGLLVACGNSGRLSRGLQEDQ